MSTPASIARTMTRLSWKLVPFKPLIKPVVHNVMSSRAMPGCWLRSFRLYRILTVDYGYLKSAAAMRSVDSAGSPVPWITYPAIEFLKQLDLRDKTVFEYGCGGSTVFWSGVAKRVDSVEDNEAFCREVRAALPANCTALTSSACAARNSGGGEIPRASSRIWATAVWISIRLAGELPASDLICSRAGSSLANKSSGALIAARYWRNSGARSVHRSRANWSRRAASSRT